MSRGTLINKLLEHIGAEIARLDRFAPRDAGEWNYRYGQLGALKGVALYLEAYDVLGAAALVARAKAAMETSIPRQVTA